jgi:Tol biopolymer transport system component
VLETIGEPGTYRGVDLSSEGRLLVHRHDASGGDIFVVESAAAPMRRLTFDASQHNSSPVWSADGSDFVFQSLRGGKWGIYQRRPAGAADEKRILESDVNTVPVAWSADKKSMLFWWLRTGSSLWRVDVAGKTEPSLVGPASSGAQYSPDGKWLLYSSVVGGASEVYLQPIGFPERKVQVSPNGGIFPRWRRDGTELFYITTLDRKLVSVAVDWVGSGSDVRIGSPVALFEVGASAATGHSGGPFHFYAVSSDGQRFLLSRPISTQAETLSPPITVIQNWALSLAR